MGLREMLDPDVLETVFRKFPQAVLVTGDDRMPEAHPSVIAELEATIATIEPWERRSRPPLAEHDVFAPDELWKREVVQRWAHVMAGQERGSIRRYSHRQAVWTPNIRNPQGKLFKA